MLLFVYERFIARRTFQIFTATSLSLVMCAGQRSGKVSSTLRPPEQFEVANRTFWKVRLDMQLNDVVVRQIDAVTIEKGYFVLFVFASPDTSKLDELQATMNSIRFVDPTH